jgi:hypothetical protein
MKAAGTLRSFYYQVGQIAHILDGQFFQALLEFLHASTGVYKILKK